MLESNQELIDQFNRDEKRWRRIKFPKLGALSHAILDLRDEMRESADRQTASAANGSDAPSDYQTYAEENSEACNHGGL